MKNCLTFLFILIISCHCYSQNRKPDFNSIDWNVQFIEASTVDSLALKLTSPYTSDIEKVRAIFSWITQHISYNVNIFNSRRPLTIKYDQFKEDTSLPAKSADEIVAQIVLDRRVAVCDGYARLFKTLCDYSGIQSKIITGFSPDNISRSRSFRTNHSWNAVMIDSAWKLVDVTWASGFVNYSDDYVQHLDESYFLANPARFIYDHYPEDPQWSFLPKAPFFSEYHATPFKFKTFSKYRINAFNPSKGVINASIGDTLQFVIDVKDAEKDKQICSDPFFDSSFLSRSADWVFLSPSYTRKNKILYTYIVDSSNVEWIHIMYNNDMILRYKINIRQKIVPDAISSAGIIKLK